MAKPKPKCILRGCKGAPHDWGLCAPHLDHIRQHGEPVDLMRIYGDVWARFWSKVAKSAEPPACRPDLGSCWLWTGAKTDGYGGMAPVRRDGRIYYLAHRLTYETVNGPVPPDRELDHLCRNRACVRPDHLEAVTDRENWERGDQIGARYKRSGKCDRGHSLDDAVLMRNGTRECRTCQVAGQKRRSKDQVRRIRRLSNSAKYRKLTEAQIAEIKRLRSEQGLSPSRIAAIIGCGDSAVSRVLANKRKGTQPITR